MMTEYFVNVYVHAISARTMLTVLGKAWDRRDQAEVAIHNYPNNGRYRLRVVQKPRPDAQTR